MKDKKFPVLSLVSAVLGGVLSVGVATVFSACGPKEDGSWMHCHDTQLALIACGIIIAVVLALATFLKSPGARKALYVIAIILCIVVLLLPGIIMPLCMVDTMRCHVVMAPFARIMAAIIGVLSIVSLVTVVKESKKDLPRYGRL